jgi:hypothetical protein
MSDRKAGTPSPCKVCHVSRAQQQNQCLHTVIKPDGSIARSVPVCASCKRALEGGRPVPSMLQDFPQIPAPKESRPIVFG